MDATLDHRQAAQAYRAVRAGGYTVRKLPACLIAVVASGPASRWSTGTTTST